MVLWGQKEALACKNPQLSITKTCSTQQYCTQQLKSKRNLEKALFPLLSLGEREWIDECCNCTAREANCHLFWRSNHASTIFNSAVRENNVEHSQII